MSRTLKPLKRGRHATLLLALLLVACGGDGDGEDATAAPQEPTAQDVASAQRSGLAAIFDSTSRELTATWTDTFEGEQGYRVETRNSAGAWVVAEDVRAAIGSGTSVSWRRIIDETTTLRVVAVRATYSVPLERTGGGAELTVDLQAANAISIEIDQIEPITGTVELSVAGAGNALSARFFAGASSIGSSTSAPRFVTEWNTEPVAPGSHLLAARVEQPSGVLIERRRVVMVADATAALALEWQQLSPGRYRLIATASAPSGIRQVEFFANNQSLGIVTSPTAQDTWVYEPFAVTIQPPASIPIKAVATGNAGERAEIAKRLVVDQVPVNQAPQVTLDQPIDGAIVRVGDTLAIAGTFVDDLPGAHAQVLVGNTVVHDTALNPFAIDYSTTGLAPGQYNVTIRAVDSSGQVGTAVRAINVSATTLEYELLGAFPEDTTLLNTEGGSLLYRLPDGTVRRWDTPNSEVELAGSKDIVDLVTPYPLEPWSMSDRYVTTVGSTGGGPIAVLFDPAGAREEIPYVPGSFFNISLRSLLEGPWLLSGTDLIHIENLVTGATHDVPGNLYNGGAFSAARERLFFTRNNGFVQGRPIVDLYAYRLADQSVTPMTGSDAANSRPKADGARVAWERMALSADPNVETRVLLAAPVTNPTSSTVKSSTARAWDLDDGWLAYVEQAPGVRSLKVDDGNSTQSISSTGSTGLNSTSAGHVIFNENDRLYTWNSTHGRRLLLETLPLQTMQDDGIAFVATGGSTAILIYRVVQ